MKKDLQLEADKVQAFLDNVLQLDFEQYTMLQKMRELVFDIYKNTSERIMYGGIMFFVDDEALGGLFVRKHHISFEFTKGFLMNDPNNFLEGQGKYRRHLKIRTLDDIKTKTVDFFIKQAL